MHIIEIFPIDEEFQYKFPQMNNITVSDEIYSERYPFSWHTGHSIITGLVLSVTS